MYLSIFLMLFLVFSSVSHAGQTYTIDVSTCTGGPKNNHVFQGDVLHFVNPASATKIHGVRSALFNSASLLPGDSYDYMVNLSTILEAPVTIEYFCGMDVSETVTISNAPIAVFPKQHLIGTQQALTVNIYLANTASGRGPVILPNIKQIQLSLDNQVVFEGDYSAFSNFILQSKVQSYNLSFNCSAMAIQARCSPWDVYQILPFTIAPDTLQQGKHTVRARLTLTTDSGGDAVYEDRGEYMVSSPFFHLPFTL